MTKSVIVAIVELECSENVLEDGKNGRVAGERDECQRDTHHAPRMSAPRDSPSRPLRPTGNARRSHKPYNAAAPRRVEVETARVHSARSATRAQSGERAGKRAGAEQAQIPAQFTACKPSLGDDA